MVQPPIFCIYQGCKRDLFYRDRDETETFNFGFETRPRLRCFSRCCKRYSQLLQIKLCCVSFSYYAKHSSVSATLFGKSVEIWNENNQMAIKMATSCNFVMSK